MSKTEVNELLAIKKAETSQKPRLTAKSFKAHIKTTAKQQITE